MTPKVFVIDNSGKPLLPTHPARARKLLRDGKAKVVRVVPFTIQLERIISNVFTFSSSPNGIISLLSLLLLIILSSF